jgi:glucokinase
VSGGTPSAVKVAGVDIGGTQCSVNLGEFSSKDGLRLLTRVQVPTRAERGPDGVLADIATHLRDILPTATRSHLQGIGISCGGPLDRRAGTVHSPPHLPGWDDVPVVAQLSEAIGTPCWLENDANANALAEWTFGAGQGMRDLVYLTFGTGLGAGVVADGTLYLGADGLAGEVGHWRLGPSRGPEVYGKRGSFEAFCSGAGIAAWYRYWSGNRDEDGAISAKVVADRARNGERLAVRVFAQAARRLGQGIAMIVDAFAPERVVVGGMFTYANDLLRPGMERVLAREAHPALLRNCRVVPAALGPHVGSYGSLSVALYRLGVWDDASHRLGIAIKV